MTVLILRFRRFAGEYKNTVGLNYRTRTLAHLAVANITSSAIGTSGLHFAAQFETSGQFDRSDGASCECLLDSCLS